VLLLAGIAVASAAGVVITVNAATTARSSEPRTPVPTATSTTIPKFVDDGTLTAPRTYRGSLISLVPPPIGTRPRVTASEAFANRGGTWRKEPPAPHLVLAVATLSGRIVPFIDQRLVWVITYRDVPANYLAHSATSTTSAGAESALTVLSFVDASTATRLGSSSFVDVPPAKCVPVRIVSKSYLSPSGAKSSRPSAGAATIYLFADGNRQLVVPPGFDPVTAGDLTLFLFGFPPRPHEPATRQQWENEYRDYRPTPVGESNCAAVNSTTTTKRGGT
jgi:hypothetical protein